MFGFGSSQKETLRRCEAMESRLIRLESALTGSLSQLGEGLESLRAAANQHDLAIADLLDTFEEQRAQEADESLRRETELYESAKRQLQTAAQQREALLQLAMLSLEQLFWLRRAARRAGDEAWERQLRLAEERLSTPALHAGLQRVDRSGVPVDFDLHSVSAVTETAQRERADTVAEVLSPGWVFGGRVVQQASVTVYRFHEEKSQ